MKREHLANFNLAGFTHYEGTLCFQELKIGSALHLVLEENNKYDARAVIIYFGEYKLGYIPRNENRIFHKLLKIGFNDFDVRIQRIDPTEHPENQIQVVVHLLSKKDE
jgi:hypothetical protein